jgi:YHS domain-containing protein
MSIHKLLTIAAFAAGFVPSPGSAQHEGHQASTPSGGSAEMAQCVQAQPAVQNILTAAAARLESARQSNSPSDMRAAIDAFEGALRDIRTQLAPCATAAPDPHAGHAMPSTQPAPAAGAPTAKTPAAADPHAGHQMPPAQPAAPAKPQAATPKAAPAQADPHADHTTAASPAGKSTSSTKAAPSKSATAATADSHAGHGSPQAGKQMDPVNGLMVDPATAPKTTYQGQTYYFSSEESRKEFLANPATFAKKPNQ